MRLASVLVLLLLTTPLLAGLGAAERQNFWGDLQPSGPIQVPLPAEFGVGAGNGIVLNRLSNVGGGNRSIIELPEADLRLFEHNFHTVPLGGGRQATVGHGTKVLAWNATAKDVRIEIVNAEPMNQLWSLVHGAASAKVGAGPDCSFAPLRRVDSDDAASVWHALTQLRRGSLVWNAIDDERRIQLTCKTTELRLQNVSNMQFGGLHLNLEYTDAELGRVRRVVETRFFVAPNATLPDVWDHDLKILMVDPPRPTKDAGLQATVNLQGPTSSVRIWTPNLVAAGQLRIPASHGSIAWDGRERSGDLDPVMPSGAFHARALSRDRVEITGYTTNGVPAAWDGEGSVSVGTWFAGIAGAAGISWMIFRALRKGLPLVGAFTRLTKDRALEHPRRRALLDAVSHNPGARIKDLCDILSLSRRIVEHHVGVLVRQGLLVRRSLGRATAFFVRPPSEPGFEHDLWLSRSSAARRVLDALAAAPGATQRRLAATTGISQPYISQLLRRLREAGVVERDGAHRRAQYRVTTQKPTLDLV